MGLKLFRHTGYSGLLDTQTAVLAWKGKTAPLGWNPLVLLVTVSLWLATVCNYALWRELFRLDRKSVV